MMTMMREEDALLEQSRVIGGECDTTSGGFVGSASVSGCDVCDTNYCHTTYGSDCGVSPNPDQCIAECVSRTCASPPFPPSPPPTPDPPSPPPPLPTGCVPKPADFDEMHGFDSALGDKCISDYTPPQYTYGEPGYGDYCECNQGDDDVCQTCKSRTCNCMDVPTGLPVGAEAGIAIGACAVIGAVAFGVFYCIRRRRNGGLMSDGQ